MATIGSLTVNLSMETAAFIADIGRATAAVEDNTSRMKTALNSLVVLNWGQVIGGFAREAIDALVGLAERSISSAADLGHMAEAAGLTTDQFQALRLGAEEAGISTDKFDVGMQRFIRSVGQARDQQGALYTSLEATNPALLQQLEHAQNGAQAFDIFMRAMAGANSTAERAQLVTAAFGRGMGQMVEMVQNGTVSVAALEDRFKNFILPQDTLDKAKELTAQVNLLTTAFEDGFAKGFLAIMGDNGSVIKQMQTVSQVAQQLGAAMGKVWNLFVDNGGKAAEDLAKVEQKLADIFIIGGALVGAFAGLPGGLLGVIMGGAAGAVGATVLIDKLGELSDKLAAVLGKANEWTATVTRAGDATTNWGASVGKVDVQHEKWLETLRVTIEQQDALLAHLNQGPVVFDQYKNHMEAVDATMKKFGETTSKAAQQFLALTEAEKNGATQIQITTELYKSTETPMGKYLDTLQKIKASNLDAVHTFIAVEDATAAMAATYLSAAGQVTTELTKLFKGNKDVAMANAVVHTAEGIANALGTLPIPFNFAMAGLLAAEGAAQIAAIEAAQPGSATAPTVSASKSAAHAAAPVQQQAVAINLIGDTFGRPQLENLVGQLKQYQKDGGTILIN